jgi:hypothetical protein
MQKDMEEAMVLLKELPRELEIPPYNIIDKALDFYQVTP